MPEVGLKATPKDIAAKGAAFKLIQSLGVSSPAQIVLEDIAMTRGVLVIEGGLQGAEARLVRKGKHGIIRVRRDITEPGRRRFAIAHELGHWELHTQSQWQLCSEGDIQEYASSPVELEASMFASELLMPTVLYRPRCQEAAPDLELIKTLAEEFTTTLTATALRFIEESNSACIVVFSKSGRVSWWKRSDKAESLGLWIEKSWEIQPQSLAWDCLQGEVVSSGGAMLEPSAWFGESCAERLGEIQEQSIRLGRYPTVLTLLWIP